jgi:citrate lyase synthetase
LLSQRLVFIATIDKREVATASLDQDVVRSVFVDPGHQGRGLILECFATPGAMQKMALMKIRNSMAHT